MLGGGCLEFAVIKRNKFGVDQPRLLVLNGNSRTLILLTEQRTKKKEIALSDIVAITVKGKTDALNPHMHAADDGDDGFQRPPPSLDADTRLNYAVAAHLEGASTNSTELIIDFAPSTKQRSFDLQCRSAVERDTFCVRLRELQPYVELNIKTADESHAEALRDVGLL